MAVTDVLLAAWALLVASVSIVACTRRPPANATGGAPPDRVLLVRPVSGTPRWLAQALVQVPLGFTGRILLCVDRPDDPARPITRAAAAILRRRGIDARAIVASGAGCNRKVAQLTDAVARHGSGRDVVVVADADVDLASLELANLWGALGPDVAACWMPCVEPRANSLGDRMSRAVLGASLHAFPVLAAIDRRLFVGKLFAVRTDALARIGGFARVADHLGEDAELARALRESGGLVVLAPGLVGSRAVDRGLDEVFARFVRWVLVVRSQRPHLLGSYPLLFAPTPILGAGAVAIGSTTAAVTVVVALASRWMLAAVAMRRCGRAVTVLDIVVDAALSDVLVLAAFARACASRRVRWRDRELRVGRDGRLRSAADPAKQQSAHDVERTHEGAVGH
jgi:ceramide glucosyltransferase